MRVLVIEDDRELRELFALLLRADGATVAEAGSGQQAIEFMRAREFDAVLSDLSLPDVPALSSRIRRISRAPANVPVCPTKSPRPGQMDCSAEARAKDATVASGDRGVYR